MNKLIKEFAIEWAKYLDWDFPNDPTEYTFTSDSLSKFAAFVAAQEREECAKECDKIERRKWEVLHNGGAMSAVGARDCAAAIRARGEP